LQFTEVFKTPIWLVFTFALHTTVMKYARYPVIASKEDHTYEFFSEGPSGRIRKIVFYEKIGDDLFNLGFGDWNSERQKVDDSIRSNNGDRDKVLATVAFTALDFTDEFPAALIFVEGSTSARTRLYQIGISNNLLEINENFEVQGYQSEHWEPFRQGRNYESFLIRRK
jgi:hypothetical protein